MLKLDTKLDKILKNKYIIFFAVLKTHFIVIFFTCRCLSRSLSLSFSLSRSRSFSRRSLARCSTSLRARSIASFLFFQSLEPSSGTNRTSLRAQEFPLPRSRTLWNLKANMYYFFHNTSILSCTAKLCYLINAIHLVHKNLCRQC